jgi:oligopeptide transport system substrate-binding protein
LAKGLIRKDPYFATHYLGFNIKKIPTNDVTFRRAVSGAIRKAELVEILGNGDLPAQSWVPPGLDGYVPYQAAGQANESRKLRGSNSSPLLASFDSGARNSLIMEKVQADLKSGLGISLLLSNMDWKSYISSLQTDSPMVFRMGWLAPYRDTYADLDLFMSDNPNNYTGWASPEYDRMEDGPARLRLIARAQHMLLVEDAVVVPLFHAVQSRVVSQRLKGVRADPWGVVHLNEIDWDHR